MLLRPRKVLLEILATEPRVFCKVVGAESDLFQEGQIVIHVHELLPGRPL